MNMMNAEITYIGFTLLFLVFYKIQIYRFVFNLPLPLQPTFGEYAG